MYGPTLSIDLGASFTKVAWRNACRPTFRHASKEEARVLSLKGSALIPSVAIRTGDPDHPWLFGRMAAQMKPGPRMEVFRNWKSKLFQKDHDQDSASAAVVAEKFFSWLRNEVTNAGIPLGGVRVTVAMPAFQHSMQAKQTILRCMGLAGWDESILVCVTEPHANLVGLLARGISCVQRNRSGETLLNYGHMFGHASPWIEAARGYSLNGTGQNCLGILVIDIGAFTTDFAHLVFDFADQHPTGDGLASMREDSLKHGVIDQLDKPVLDALARRHSISWLTSTSDEIELLKVDLYSGRTQQLFNIHDDPVTLGDAVDQVAIKEVAEGFHDKVWRAAKEFLGKDQVQLAYLTGGGCRIPIVKDGLKSALAHAEIKCFDLPERSMSPADNCWRTWSTHDGGLERLATALGGTSVILEASPEPPTQGVTRVQTSPARVEPARDPISCTCGGNNPDCARCGGRGYINRRRGR